MKCHFRIAKLTLSLSQLQAAMPTNFSLRQEGEIFLLSLEVPDNLTRDQIWSLVNQEVDRIFFLTGEQLQPELSSIEKSDGKTESFLKFTINLVTKRLLSADVAPQKWRDNLSLQLRLWQLAHIENMPISTQIVLLFQIVESDYPVTNDSKQYPEYVKGGSLDPRTEAKLIRDWVGHQKGPTPKFGSQLNNYCQLLGLTEFYNPTNQTHAQLIPGLLAKVSEEARKVIVAQITTI